MLIKYIYQLLLFVSIFVLFGNARLIGNNNINDVNDYHDYNEEDSTNTVLSSYSNGESHYMVWDFSERGVPTRILGEREDEMFGSAVTVWDQYMVIGASGDRSREFASGAVYVYSKQMYGDGSYYWTLVELLEPWDGHDGDNFGCAVDLHLYTLVVGSNMHDENGQDAGAAYIYECYNNAEHHHDPEHDHDKEEMQRMWYLAAKLMPDEGLPQDYFGSTVATQGNVTAVGAYGSDIMATFSGAVFVWRKKWTFVDPHRPWEWIYDETIAASDGHRYDFFGTSIAVYDDKLAVGAYGVDEGDLYKVGAVYVYLNSYDDSTDDGLSYQLLSKLTPGDDGVTLENFGQSVAMWDGNLVVGAPNSDANEIEAAGAFYSYGFDKYHMPYFIEKVSPEFPTRNGHCGYSIDIYEDLAVMGCPNASGFGSIYIYTEVSPLTTPSTKHIQWLYESRKRLADKWSIGDMFGYTVSAYDDTVAAGAYKSHFGVGSTYLYMGRKKVYQDHFGNVTDDDLTVDEDDTDESIEDILLAFEEAHPRESKMIIIIMFLMVLAIITVYAKGRKQALVDNSRSLTEKNAYELAALDSSHGVFQPTTGHEKRGYNNHGLSNMDESLPDSTQSSAKDDAYTYTPISSSSVAGSSRRVRDLDAAGLLGKSYEKSKTPESFKPPVSSSTKSVEIRNEPPQSASKSSNALGEAEVTSQRVRDMAADLLAKSRKKHTPLQSPTRSLESMESKNGTGHSHLDSSN